MGVRRRVSEGWGVWSSGFERMALDCEVAIIGWIRFFATPKRRRR